MLFVIFIVVLFGEVLVIDKILNDVFFNYISKIERDIIFLVLNRDSFEEEVFDDLIDFLDRFFCK